MNEHNELPSIVSEKIREHTALSPKDDAFNYNGLAKNLLRYILSKKLPLSVGVFGKLGSGKSVLLHFFKQAVTNKRGLKFIDFDAANFMNKETDLLFELQRKILSSPLVWGARIFAIIIWFVGLPLAPILVGLIETRNAATELATYALTNNYSVASWSALSIGLIIFISFQHLPAFIDKHKGINAWLINFLFGGWSRLPGIKKIFRKWTGKTTIIAIENLDRVSPQIALSFLEQLKALMLEDSQFRSNQFVFLILCDFSILEKEVNKIYDGSISTRDYLNKLIEVSFYLPTYRENANKHFIKSLLSPAIPDADMDTIAEILHGSMIQTPRDVKNYLMDLDMLYIMAKSKGFGEKNLLTKLPKILTLWIIKNKYPDLYPLIKTLNERSPFPQSQFELAVGSENNATSTIVWGMLKRRGLLGGKPVRASVDFDMIIEIVDSPYSMKVVRADGNADLS